MTWLSQYMVKYIIIHEHIEQSSYHICAHWTMVTCEIMKYKLRNEMLTEYRKNVYLQVI